MLFETVESETDHAGGAHVHGGLRNGPGPIRVVLISHLLGGDRPRLICSQCYQPVSRGAVRRSDVENQESGARPGGTLSPARAWFCPGRLSNGYRHALFRRQRTDSRSGGFQPDPVHVCVHSDETN
uniref:Uncharacterized protein n=1 Tax=Cacopsylla melanoneura TaxID=428564 RepID=A0A8D8UWG4_9HEMI